MYTTLLGSFSTFLSSLFLIFSKGFIYLFIFTIIVEFHNEVFFLKLVVQIFNDPFCFDQSVFAGYEYMILMGNFATFFLLSS